MPTAAPVTLNLALQGGGSHGAFTWGVLDRLLQEEWLVLEGISGTSAGAMNAAVLADGWQRGGREGARQLLAEFWGRVAEGGRTSLFRRSFLDVMLGDWNLDASPGAAMLETMHTLVSPSQFNPMGWNPLRRLLGEVLDLDSLHASPVRVFACATNVRTGRPRVFTNLAAEQRPNLHEAAPLTVDALLASACLPVMFEAVQIDGDPYWDGGYVGNPALWPLIYGCQSHDIAIVQINPLIREGTPRTPAQIANRAREISFNNALMSEMRAIAFVDRLIEGDTLNRPEAARYKKLHIHRIHAEEAMRRLGGASKLNTEPDFVGYLHHLGLATASAWLEANAGDIGNRSSINVAATYL